MPLLRTSKRWPCATAQLEAVVPVPQGGSALVIRISLTSTISAYMRCHIYCRDTRAIHICRFGPQSERDTHPRCTPGKCRPQPSRRSARLPENHDLTARTPSWSRATIDLSLRCALVAIRDGLLCLALSAASIAYVHRRHPLGNTCWCG